MMLLENELETTRQENGNLSNVVEVVLADQEKLLTLINFWQGEYLGYFFYFLFRKFLLGGMLKES